MSNEKIHFRDNCLYFFMQVDLPLYDTQLNMLRQDIRGLLKLKDEEPLLFHVGHDWYGSFRLELLLDEKDNDPEEFSQFLKCLELYNDCPRDFSTLDLLCQLSAWGENFNCDGKGLECTRDLVEEICCLPRLTKEAGYRFCKKEEGERMLELYKSVTGKEPVGDDRLDIMEAITTAHFEQERDDHLAEIGPTS